MPMTNDALAPIRELATLMPTARHALDYATRRLMKLGDCPAFYREAAQHMAHCAGEAESTRKTLLAQQYAKAADTYSRKAG